MPTVDASQFARFKRVNAVQRVVGDSKSVNRLTAYNTRLSETSVLTSFLPTPTLKSSQPLTLVSKSVLGKIGLLHQRCA
jgi:hypothetical protein